MKMKELKNIITNLIGSVEPKIIDKFYARGTEGNYILSFAPKGTLVEYGEDNYYIYEKDTVIIGWEQKPNYDSGYMRYEFEITPETIDEVIHTWYEYRENE